MSVKLLQLYGPKVFGGFFYSLFWVFFSHACSLFGKEVQWSFPVFHIQKKSNEHKHFSRQKQFHTATFATGRGLTFFFGDSRKAFWVNAGPTSGLTFKNTCQIKSRVQNRAKAMGLETDLDSALLCVVGGVMNRTKKKKKRETKTKQRGSQNILRLRFRKKVIYTLITMVNP